MRPSEIAVPPLADDRVHRSHDRLAIAGWSRDRAERSRERRDDDAIVPSEEIGEPPGGRANELHSGMHALTGVHEQDVVHGQRLDADEIDRLGLVVLQHVERRGIEAVDDPVGLVRHGRFEEHARGARAFEDLERLELDRIAGGVAERVAGFDADAGRLERVGVGPFDGVRRTFRVVACRHVVHEEPDRRERDVRRVRDLRDDADGAGQSGAAERRRDAHRQLRAVRITGGVEGGPPPSRV